MSAMHTGTVTANPLERSPLGTRAAEFGHVVEVKHEGKRFRIACSCGWQTGLNWTRKRVFDAVMDHCIGVVREGEGALVRASQFPDTL